MYVLHIVQYVNFCLSSSLSIPYEGGNQSPCSQSKHGCLRPRKKTKSLEVLFEISVKVVLVQMLFHSEAPGLTSPRYEIFFTVIQLNMQVYLSLWRRQTKSSPISAKIFIAYYSRYGVFRTIGIFAYLYPFQRYAKFSIFSFFNSARLFKNLFSWKLHC